jgi:hypothetical protein
VGRYLGCFIVLDQVRGFYDDNPVLVAAFVDKDRPVGLKWGFILELQHRPSLSL